MDVQQLCQGFGTISFPPQVNAESTFQPILTGANNTGDFRTLLRDRHCIWVRPFQGKRSWDRVSRVEGRRLQNVTLDPGQKRLEPVFLCSPEQSFPIFRVIAMLFIAMLAKGRVVQETFATDPTHHWRRSDGEAVQLWEVDSAEQQPQGGCVPGLLPAWALGQ